MNEGCDKDYADRLDMNTMEERKFYVKQTLPKSSERPTI